ncbi:hypothetical protein VE00_06402 [Pseudogymnoascus sp. WSF 3629]|nr:hypothetical protein VE00_06402 [Pseudogymnoascus sp. WSF 3629]
MEHLDAKGATKLGKLYDTTVLQIIQGLEIDIPKPSVKFIGGPKKRACPPKNSASKPKSKRTRVSKDSAPMSKRARPSKSLSFKPVITSSESMVPNKALEAVATEQNDWNIPVQSPALEHQQSSSQAASNGPMRGNPASLGHSWVENDQYQRPSSNRPFTAWQGSQIGQANDAIQPESPNPESASFPQNLNYQQYQSDISVLNSDLQTYTQTDGRSLENTIIDGIGSLLAAGSLLEASHYPPTIDEHHLEPISHYLNPNQGLVYEDTDLPPPGLTTTPQQNCAQDTALVQFQGVEDETSNATNNTTFSEECCWSQPDPFEGVDFDQFGDIGYLGESL